ncbi:MAG: hypothetical protein ACFE0I_20325 [Elainellaceae cyanobacterium]
MKRLINPIKFVALLGLGAAGFAIYSLAADAQSGCDSSYPTVCIPSPPPDLDCGEIPHRRFQVRQPDPHRFDGDKDGIGCEVG